MKDLDVFSVYGEMKEADPAITKSLTNFYIEKIGLTETVKRHYFDDEIGEEVHNSRVEGGLTLILSNGSVRKKVILGYTELGEWLEFEGVEYV